MTNSLNYLELRRSARALIADLHHLRHAHPAYLAWVLALCDEAARQLEEFVEGRARSVLGVLANGPATAAQVAHESGLRTTRTRETLRRLLEAGVVQAERETRRAGQGGRSPLLYRLVEEISLSK